MCRRFFVPILLLFSLAESRIVNTIHGKIEGRSYYVNASFGNQNKKVLIDAFEGIPYAAAPVGSLRFLPPVTNAKWHNVLAAKSPKPACPQFFPNWQNASQANLHMSQSRIEYLKKYKRRIGQGEEDCLYLNIYVPRKI